MQQHFLNNGMPSITSAVIYKQELIHRNEISFFEFLILIGQSWHWALKYFLLQPKRYKLNISVPFQTNTHQNKWSQKWKLCHHVWHYICSKHDLLSHVGCKKKKTFWEMFQCFLSKQWKSMSSNVVVWFNVLQNIF